MYCISITNELNPHHTRFTSISWYRNYQSVNHRHGLRQHTLILLNSKSDFKERTSLKRMETPFNKCAYSIAVVLIWLCIVSSHKIIYDELLSDVQTIGRACRFQRNDTPGVCRELSDCSQVYAELTELNVAPTTCWFDHDAPVVCCYVAPGLRGELQLDRRSSDSKLKWLWSLLNIFKN